MACRFFGGRQLVAHMWDGITNDAAIRVSLGWLFCEFTALTSNLGIIQKLYFVLCIVCRLERPLKSKRRGWRGLQLRSRAVRLLRKIKTEL